MPSFVRWPGVVKPNSISTSVHSNMDIFPTILSLAGAPTPADRMIDGKDLSPVILRGDDQGHPWLPIYRNAALFAMRFGSWKAHFATRSGYGDDKVMYHSPPLLFNVDVDPSEMYPVDIRSRPDLWAQLNTSVASHFATLTVGKNLLPFTDQKYEVCCDRAKACNCTNPYGPGHQAIPAGPHTIGERWWTVGTENDW